MPRGMRRSQQRPRFTGNAPRFARENDAICTCRRSTIIWCIFGTLCIVAIGSTSFWAGRRIGGGAPGESSIGFAGAVTIIYVNYIEFCKKLVGFHGIWLFVLDFTVSAESAHADYFFVCVRRP